MNILTKSNFRKNKGTSIGLFILMILTAMLIGVVFLLFLDAIPNVEKDAKRLDAGDGVTMISKNREGIDDDFIAEVLKKDVERYETKRMLLYPETALKFAKGTTILNLLVNNKSELDGSMNRTEIVDEDTSITENYVYLPYQSYVSGGFHTGDNYELNLPGKKYSLTVRGFLNDTYFGCNNMGTYEYIVDDATYEELYESDHTTQGVIVVSFDLKENVKASKFKIYLLNSFIGKNPEVKLNTELISTTVTGKTFMGMILTVSFLMMAIILVVVILLMVKSSITNYIRENMQSIGALKSIGYTSGKIRRSMYTMFLILALIGSLIGTGLSYLVMPMMSKIVTGQSGVPYQISFNAIATILPVVFVILFILFVSAVSSRKIKKIEAIEALRDGQKSHNFKKNRVRLDRTSCGLNLALSLKTTIGNMKQNLITFFVTGLLVFGCVMALLMFENFNLHPRMNIFSTEIGDGALGVDAGKKFEVQDFLLQHENVKNVRRSMMLYSITYKDEEKFFGYAFEDVSKMDNQDVCYDGELPRYDNEVAVSGAFAKDYGYEIGDELELTCGDVKYRYLITGLIQSCSNLGRELVMSEEAVGHLFNIDNNSAYLWFDVENGINENEILDEATEKYGEHIQSTASMNDTMEAMLVTFSGITTVMMTMMFVISGMVILLVLFLMVRTLIYNKRKDYGIYKAIGFTSGKLMLQTALSFMPTIILSVAVFSVVSCFLANPYMNAMMRSFGMMKCNFSISITGVLVIGVGMVLLAFAFAMLLTRRIRRIEAYQMLVGE